MASSSRKRAPRKKSAKAKSRQQRRPAKKPTAKPDVIDAFVSITRGIIAKDGLDDYLPTLLLPGSKEILVLEGAPNDASLAGIAKRWAKEHAGKTADFVLAYRSGGRHFAVYARVGGKLQTRKELVDGA